MNKHYPIYLVLAATAAAVSANAAVKMPRIFDTCMVIQRDVEFPVFGKADPGEKVTVSFAGQKRECVTDSEGYWRTTLSPMKASCEPRDLVVIGASTTNTISDVLVGDVWLCSGQSNMEFSMAWHPIGWEEFQEEAAKFPTIRTCRVNGYQDDPFPKHDIDYFPYTGIPKGGTSSWRHVNDKFFLGTTAVGYFFARRLTIETGLPIAIIDASWSAQRIEPFVPQNRIMAMDNPAAEKLKSLYPSTPEGKATCEKYVKDLKQWVADVRAASAEGREITAVRPEYGNLMDGENWLGTHYNRMIVPLTHLPIKGVIWYQGCANADIGEKYLDFFKELVAGWREAWNQPELPFYSVQLAAFWDVWRKVDSVAGGDGFVPVREAQRKSASIPHTGIAVAYDLGEPYEIHPKEKYHVGERLALWALRNEYGKKDLVCSGPLYRSCKPEGNSIRVNFDWVGSGLMVGYKTYSNNLDTVEAPKGTKLSGFAIAGSDKVWYNAEAKIVNDTVVLTSTNVPAPVAVRYAYHGAPLEPCNLYNREGLPASPFRSDDW